MLAVDPFDPKTWDTNTHEYRIYGDDNASVYAVVDRADYLWAVEWKWSPKVSRGGKKVYLRRVGHEGSRESRTCATIWLHIEIMRRKGTRKPTPQHTIVCHRDSDGLNCRRQNLHWATPATNARYNVKRAA